jgi:hypothetical protein
MSASDRGPVDDGPTYSWWQVGRYCYICGWLGRLPLVGYPIVRWHFNRLDRKDR